MEAPAGAPASGRSGSAPAGRVRRGRREGEAASSAIVASPGTSSTGATFASVTVSVVIADCRLPSVTSTLNVYTPGPCASVGVQVKAPPVSMAAPAGAPTSANVSACAGRSHRSPCGERVDRPLGIVAEGGTSARIGATFASVTVSVVVADAVAMPSETSTLNVYLPGPCASLGVQLNSPRDRADRGAQSGRYDRG